MRLRLADQAAILASLFPIFLGLSCTRYDYLTQDIYEQATYSNQVDILFVVDNSESMLDEQEALATNFDAFIQNINSAAEQEKSFPKDNLADAVKNYLFFLNNFSRFINFRLGMTTTELGSSGQDGLLLPPYEDDPEAPLYISLDDSDVVGAFEDLVGEVQANMSAVGEEMGLGAMRRAICMALPEPELFDETTRADLTLGCHDVIEDGESNVNGDFLRDGVALAVVVVSDEGDSSPAQPEDYIEFLDALERGYSFSAISPTLPRDTGDEIEACNPESSLSEELERYREVVEGSGGILAPICGEFSEALNNIGALINNLLSRFKLQKVPQDGSILVFVNGMAIPESDENGWVFRPSLNSIEFTGSAVPDYGSNIEVYYRAVTNEDPRSLPF